MAPEAVDIKLSAGNIEIKSCVETIDSDVSKSRKAIYS